MRLYFKLLLLFLSFKTITIGQSGFVENKGQIVDQYGNPQDQVLFKLNTQALDLYITKTGVTYVFKEQKDRIRPNKEIDTSDVRLEIIRLTLQNSHISPENIAVEKSSKDGPKYNYFLGHCPQGICNVSVFEKVLIKDVYPGIDWVFYRSNENGYKYDFVVHGGSDPDQIQLVYQSLQKGSISASGSFSIPTEFGALTDQAPVSYFKGKRIRSQYKLADQKENEYGGYDSHIQFAIDWKVRNELLLSTTDSVVIDPSVLWATYINTDNEFMNKAIETDSEGHLYLTGFSSSTNFPVLNTGTYFQANVPYDMDIVISKFTNNGVLLWGTYYGGTSVELNYLDIAIDTNDNLYVSGSTQSSDFPLQNSGGYFDPTQAVPSNGLYMLKFDNSGNRLWSTYFGAGQLNSIAIDENNNVIIVGFTGYQTFPLLDAGTYFQSSTNGAIYTGFISKFDGNDNLTWSTFFGGSTAEELIGVDTDSEGNVFVCGMSWSADYPLLDNGNFFQDTLYNSSAILARFDPQGNLTWSTYMDGSIDELALAVKVDPNDNIFVSGWTISPDLPTLDAGTFYYPTGPANTSHQFYTKFSNNGQMIWSSYDGSQQNIWWGQLNDNQMTIDDCGNFYVVGTALYENLVTLPFPDGGFYSDTLLEYEADTTWRSDLYFSKFDNDGNLLGATYYGYHECDWYPIITTDREMNVWLSYIYWRTMDTINPMPQPPYPTVDPGNGAYFSANPDSLQGLSHVFLTKMGQYKFEVHDTAICANAGITIDLGFPNATYNWSNGTTSSSVYVNETDTLWVETNINSCIYADTIIITVQEIHAVYQVDTLFCAPAELQFTDSSWVNIGSIVHWDWQFDNSESSNDVNPETTYEDPGIYTPILMVTSDLGCTDQVDSVDIEVLENVHAQFLTEPSILYTNHNVSFINQSVNESSWYWYLEDSLISTGENPFFNFSSAGEYEITLVAKHTNGCSDTATRNITVRDEIVLYVPNTFTPDDDEINRYWKAYGDGTDLAEFSIKVLNKYDQVIFKSNDIHEAWDGTYNGRMVQNGTYTWFISFRDSKTNEFFRYVGHVNVIK